MQIIREITPDIERRLAAVGGCPVFVLRTIIAEKAARGATFFAYYRPDPFMFLPMLKLPPEMTMDNKSVCVHPFDICWPHLGSSPNPDRPTNFGQFGSQGTIMFDAVRETRGDILVACDNYKSLFQKSLPTAPGKFRKVHDLFRKSSITEVSAQEALNPAYSHSVRTREKYSSDCESPVLDSILAQFSILMTMPWKPPTFFKVSDPVTSEWLCSTALWTPPFSSMTYWINSWYPSRDNRRLGYLSVHTAIMIAAAHGFKEINLGWDFFKYKEEFPYSRRCPVLYPYEETLP